MPEPLLRALDLTIARRVEGLLPGDHRSSLLGRGSELAQIRPYEPVEDDVRQIDWNVTARTGTPHVRIHLAERALVTWLVLDTSRLDDVRHGASVARPTSPRAPRSRSATPRPGAATASGSSRSGMTHPRTLPARQGRAGLLGLLLALRKEEAAGERTPGGRCDLDRRGAAARRRRWRVSARTSSSSPTSAARATGAGRCWRSAGATRSSPSRSATRASRSCRSSGSCAWSTPRPAASSRSTPRATRLRAAFAAAAAQERAEVAAEITSAGARHVVLSTARRLAARADRLPAPRGRAVSFASPVALWALLLVPIARSATSCSSAGACASRAQFVVAGAAARTSSTGSRPGRRHLPVALLLLAVAAFLVGFARPHATLSERSEEATVVLAIDTSRSMGATDVPPTRLAAAQASARRFLAGLPAQVPRRGRRLQLAGAGRGRADHRPRVRDAPRSTPCASERARRSATGSRPRSQVATGTPPGKKPPAGQKPPPAAILIISDGAQDGGRITSRDGDRAGADGQGAGLHRAARDAGRRRVGAARRRLHPSGSRCRRTPARSRAVAPQTGGRFYQAPTQDDLGAVYKDLKSRLGNDAQERGDHRRLRRRPARCCCSSAARSRRSGSGGSRDPALPWSFSPRPRLSVCAPRRARPRTSARRLQICIPVAGPWVAIPRSGGGFATATWRLACPQGVVGGVDARASEAAVAVEFPGLHRQPRESGHHDGGVAASSRAPTRAGRTGPRATSRSSAAFPAWRRRAAHARRVHAAPRAVKPGSRSRCASRRCGCAEGTLARATLACRAGERLLTAHAQRRPLHRGRADGGAARRRPRRPRAPRLDRSSSARRAAACPQAYAPRCRCRRSAPR